MQFISTTKEHQVVLRPRRRKVVETTDQGAITEVIPGIRAKFRPLAAPFLTTLLPTKQNSGGAWGILNSEDVAAEYGVPEQEIVDALMNHSAYGNSFIGLDSSGTAEADLEGIYIEARENGEFFCSLCNKMIATAQGLNGHKRSIVHMQLLKQADSTAKEALSD
jgi:hypothetical protein